MKKLIILSTVLVCAHFSLQSQIGINNDNSSPDASAMLDVKSTAKGFLAPRMTSSQKANILTPAEGLLVFDTTTKSYWFYTGGDWEEITIKSGWLTTPGNIPTNISEEIYRSSNIGIGITNPSFPLDVQGSSGVRLRTNSTDNFFAGYISKNNTSEFFAGVQATFETNDAISGYHIYDNTRGVRRFVIDKDGDVGINESNPNARLHINGDFRLVDGTQGAGKVLTSDAGGLSSWTTLIDNVADADNDPMNEIEIPTGGTIGQILATDGTGTLSWANDKIVDNLGNHTATQNVTLGTNYISSDGTASGIFIDGANEVGINTNNPVDRLHVFSGGNGTRVRSQNSGNGWAGFLSKNSIGEVFMGLQGAFDANPGEFHIFDNGAGARRMVIDATGNVGIGRDNPTVKLDVNGSVNCTGGTCSSDMRWKKNIHPLENVLEKVLQLRGVSYDWRSSDFPEKNFTNDRQIGVLAQEIEVVFPELIKTDNLGYKSMDYMSFTAVLLESVKMLKAENEKQEEMNQSLASEVEKLKGELERLERHEVKLARIEALLGIGEVDKAEEVRMDE